MVIDLNKVPDNFFLPAYMIRDIRKASILPKGKRESGKPDIVLQSPLGITEVVSRRDLVTKFRYLNGRRIHLGAWRNNKANLVILAGSPNKQYYVLKIPKSKIVKVNDKVVREKEVYIVCEGIEGDLQRESVYIVSPKMFCKMFKMQGSIHHLNNNTSITPKVNINSKVENNTAEVDSQSSRVDNKIKVNIYKNKADVYAENNKTEKYSAVAKIMRDKQLIGFVISKDGNNINVDIQTMKSLVSEGKVEHVALRRVDGKTHLYGVGIKLSELPQVQG